MKHRQVHGAPLCLEASGASQALIPTIKIGLGPISATLPSNTPPVMRLLSRETAPHSAHKCLHTHMPVHIHAYAHVPPTPMPAHTHACTYTHLHTCLCTNMPVHTHACTHTCLHIHTPTHTCLCTHMPVHTCLHHNLPDSYLGLSLEPPSTTPASHSSA